MASPAPDEVRVSDIARRILVAVTLALIAAIVAGGVLLWPDHAHHRAATDAIAPDALYDAVVTKVVRASCDGGDAAVTTSTCTTAHVRLREGPADGRVIQLPQESDSDVRLDVGDDVVVAHYADADPGLQYAYADRERRQPLAALVALVALIAVALGRWRGLGALAALASAVVVVTAFVLPALLDGGEPALVALVGGGAIVVAVVFLRRGLGAGSAIAAVAALLSLALVTAMAWGAVRWTHVTVPGNVDVLGVGAASDRVQGIVLAGMVVGAAGVLCDLAVRQVAAVWGVRGVEPPASRVAVFRAAMRSGRDSVASGVTMLVLAYLGVALPLLLVLTETRRGIVDAINGDVVAVEVVRALAGAAGLAISVPLTTLLATWVIGTARPERRRDDPRAYRNRHERALWAAAAAAEPTLPDRPDRAL